MSQSKLQVLIRFYLVPALELGGRKKIKEKKDICTAFGDLKFDFYARTFDSLINLYIYTFVCCLFFPIVTKPGVLPEAGRPMTCETGHGAQIGRKAHGGHGRAKA